MDNKHIGGDFDDFLRDEGILDEAEAVAAKRVIAFQIAQEMERAHISQSELARRMKTSRSAVERLLDPTNPRSRFNTRARRECGGQAAQDSAHGAVSHFEQHGRARPDIV